MMIDTPTWRAKTNGRRDKLRLAWIGLWLALILAGCTTTASGPVPYRLASGETQEGDLRVVEGDAILEAGAHLAGSVYIISGSLRLEPQAEVDEDIVILSGALDMKPEALVHGDVVMFSGLLAMQQEAQIGGELTTSLSRFMQEVGARLLRQALLLCCLPALAVMAVIGIVALVRRGKQARRAKSEPGEILP